MVTEVYLDLYLDTFVKPFKRPNTAACYRRAFAALPPSVKRCELAALDGLQLQMAINARARRYPRAAQLLYSCLCAAMKQAVALGYLARSPMMGCIKPVHQAKKTPVLSPDQLRKYIDAARQEAAFPLLLLMATCGLRRGEALGLRWADVNLRSGELQVNLQRLRIDGAYRLCPLKSVSSKRIITLAPPIQQELAAYRQAVLREWCSQGHWSAPAFVYDTNPDSLAKAHARVLEHAGLPHVSLHGLRHSMATAAAEQGCPIKILQGILGHSKYELTANLYADHIRHAAYAPHLNHLAAYLMG